ncbi:MAG: hypothetical protein M3P29_11330 [Acidobacteriota bacterium]|nr:hypothetical protein [Acidobacteriota bacterium]
MKFPHPIRNAKALIYTPYGNQLVLQFAEMLIDAENLGTDDGNPDVGDARGGQEAARFSGRHSVPRTEMIKESLTWLDRYLGVPR